MWWICQRERGDAHAYRARIDKINAAQGCSVCSSRELARGENDLGTVEPMLSIELHLTRNHKDADEIFPGDTKPWLQCLVNKHVHAQTIQNRRQSKGFPKCRLKDRILVY
ncbi:hypothetical protein [Leifsonia sp. YAF41]|uniref:hypothetical protein n=1 Tax=Leifsonia sp. YAF41 TaxID=3233086 RepID=UPI003F9E713B